MIPEPEPQTPPSELQLPADRVTTINVDDRITLPDGTTPLIVAWEMPTDEVGEHHCKLYLN